MRQLVKWGPGVKLGKQLSETTPLYKISIPSYVLEPTI